MSAARFLSSVGPTFNLYIGVLFALFIVSRVTGKPSFLIVSIKAVAFSFLLKLPAWRVQRLNSDFTFGALATLFSGLLMVLAGGIMVFTGVLGLAETGFLGCSNVG